MLVAIDILLRTHDPNGAQPDKTRQGKSRIDLLEPKCFAQNAQNTITFSQQFLLNNYNEPGITINEIRKDICHNILGHIPKYTEKLKYSKYVKLIISPKNTTTMLKYM